MKQVRIYDIYLATGVDGFKGMLGCASDELRRGNIDGVNYYLRRLNNNLEHFISETGLHRSIKSLVSLHESIDKFVRGYRYSAMSVEEFLYRIFKSFDIIKEFVFGMLYLGL